MAATPSEGLERLGVDTAGGRLDRCWLFRGPLHRGVSVRFNIAGVHVSGARYSWALSRGVLPAGRVYRICCRRRCVAPHHLTDKRPRDNWLLSRSALARLRHAWGAGVPVHVLAAQRALTIAVVERLVAGAA